MDHLWSPWRYQYVQKANRDSGCVLCEAAASEKDDENFLVYRGQHNFILLNLYPYTTGHLMIVPYEHVDMLEAASQSALEEMMLLAQASQKHLHEIYNAPGYNLGMNLGQSAGAGIADTRQSGTGRETARQGRRRGAERRRSGATRSIQEKMNDGAPARHALPLLLVRCAPYYL